MERHSPRTRCHLAADSGRAYAGLLNKMGHKLACWSCLSFVVVLSRWHRASADTCVSKLTMSMQEYLSIMLSVEPQAPVFRRHPFNLPAIRGPQRSLQQDTTADSM